MHDAMQQKSSASQQAIERWEEAFADGLVAASRRDAPEPWLAGHVHVARDLPAQPDPVDTGGLGDTHQLILYQSRCFTSETIPGEGTLFDGVVNPGQALVVPPESVSGPTLTSWSNGFSFTGVMLTRAAVAEAARALDLDYAALEFRERFAHDDPLLEGLICALGVELEAGAPGGRLYAEQLMQAVAVHLVAKHTAGDPKLKACRGGLPKVRLRRVEDYVRTHFGGEIALEDLAAEAGYSAYHFCREFGRATGETPFQYVTRLRMEEAARLLKAEPERLVVQVAFDVGYAGAGAFATAFKRHHGLTPTQYRRTAAR